MRIDEAIHYLDRIKQEYDCSYEEDALNMAIKALEQRPCDAVSREAAVNACLNGWNKDYKEIVADIRALPSVQPKQRTGRWIKHSDNVGNWWECDQCGTDWGGAVNYCPNCGRKMEEVDG